MPISLRNIIFINLQNSKYELKFLAFSLCTSRRVGLRKKHENEKHENEESSPTRIILVKMKA